VVGGVGGLKGHRPLPRPLGPIRCLLVGFRLISCWLRVLNTGQKLFNRPILTLSTPSRTAETLHFAHRRQLESPVPQRHLDAPRWAASQTSE
jgi:hypothetical protein